jgi:hypothetical protein
MKLLGLIWSLSLCLPFLTCTAATAVETSIVLEHGEPDQVLLGWESIPGVSYNVLSTDQLNQPLWITLNPQPLLAETNLQNYRDPVMGSSRLYQVVQSEGIRLKVIGISEQAWQASDVWVPSTQADPVSGSKTLITLGCWWDDGYRRTSLPIDTSGTFSNSISPKVGLEHAPVQVQVAFEAAASVTGHTITPPVIGGTGDGFFMLLEIEGLVTNWPVRDSGQSRKSHPFFGPGDPNTIKTITATTDGGAAQVGDLAIAIFAMDNNSNPDINISLPSGWTSLGFNNAAVDNIGYRACYKIVTSAGAQTATCTWSDDSTFVAEAALVVFKAGGP